MHNTDLKTFRIELILRIRAKNEELINLEGKLKAVDGMLEVMKKGTQKQAIFDSNDSPSIALYFGMQAKEAVITLLNDYPDREWRMSEVKDVLTQNGFKTTTRHIYSLLAATLDRLAREGVVALEKTDKGKRYRKITNKGITPIKKPFTYPINLK